MIEKLKVEFPSQGWKQLLTSRKEILDSYDRAREQARDHEVETYHGRVAEAEFRKWLQNFLPKRYGVTSGYIVSQGLKSTDKTPHYDVIIFDQLESPVLWVEDSPDVSKAGRSLAIPAEYVCCVLEIKASLSSKSIGEAIGHLKDLLPLMGGLDDPSEKYKLHLPRKFCCGLAFIELRQTEQFSEAVLSKLISGAELRGFLGGIVLRGEGILKPSSGRLSLLQSETPIEGSVGKGKESLISGGITLSSSVPVGDALHYGAMLSWAEMNFSQFGFDLMAMMRGTYEVGRISSFFGMGSS